MGLRQAIGVSPWITVLSYHRVAPVEAVGDFEDGTVDVTPEAFDVHVAYAAKWFDIIGIDDLLSFVHGGSLPKNPLLFTFDDGYKDNRTTALPILQKHGAKATFFISTTYISDRRIFWWDKLSYMVKRSTKERFEITYPEKISVRLGKTTERRQAFKTLRKCITEHYGIDLWRFLDHVAEASGVSIPRDQERRFADEMVMTWDDVKAMRSAGMDIQSHTCDHYVLPTMTDELLRSELARSREIIEGELKEPVRAISYPVGRFVSRPSLRKDVRDAGYELGFSNATGINHRWHLDPLNVKRISLDIDSPDSYFRTAMAIPYI